MKTNLWKLSCMALAMAAIVTGCNQNNELGTPAPSSEEDVLNVVATANDFVSSDATSRVSETDYTTTFEEGDAIGVFVVCDGEALVSNMKMTLGADGTTWAGENGAKLYYYKDADYIAYSPYTEGLSVTSEEEIITHFTTNLKNSTGQSTLADYQAADLKTASVVAANVTRGQNITFSFAHKMSMIEIKVPIRAYTTTGGYEYSAPLGLKVKIGDKEGFSLCTFGKETTGDAGSEVTKGIYRCIVAPSETALNVEGEFQDGSVPVYFPATGGAALSVTPKAGEYKGIDVKYDYGTYSAERDLQVGDYYYADGSIYPNELSNVPETGCIGKIFSLSTTAEDKAHGWVNGYVIALKNVEGTMASATYAYGKWSSNTSEVAGGADNAVYSQNATNDGMTDDKKQAVFAAKNGYDMTLTLVEKGIIAAILARNYDCAYPEGTSGWFLPAPGQVVEFLNNMSPNVGSGSWDFSTSNGFTDSSEQTQKTEMLQAVQAAFSIGDFFKGQSIENGVGAITDRWWTTLEVDKATAWAVEMKVNGLLKFLPRGKNSNNASVRPILAF